MNKIRTGQTINEIVISVDGWNTPVVPATFDARLYYNGLTQLNISSIDLVDASTGIYNISWSGDTLGTYQLYAKNNSTNTLFISDMYNAVPDSEIDMNIYVGL